MRGQLSPSPPPLCHGGGTLVTVEEEAGLLSESVYRHFEEEKLSLAPFGIRTPAPSIPQARRYTVNYSTTNMEGQSKTTNVLIKFANLHVDIRN